MNAKQLAAHQQAVFDLFGYPQCLVCKHYHGDKACAAFLVIPDEILDGTKDHTLPYQGDRGIMFEERPE